MAQERTGRGALAAAARLAEQAAKDAGDGERPLIWVREDGAICVGNECIVLKRGEAKSLDVEIHPDRGCNTDELAGLIFETIGRGGDTNFKVKGHLDASK